VPTERTCAQRGSAYPGSTGSQGHEAQDARQFASWGVDSLKYDWCSPDGTRDEQVARFTVMRDAVPATGRPIFYSINPNSYHAITGDKYNWGEVAAAERLRRRAPFRSGDRQRGSRPSCCTNSRESIQR
jgi:alpha-galactosidase